MLITIASFFSFDSQQSLQVLFPIKADELKKTRIRNLKKSLDLDGDGVFDIIGSSGYGQDQGIRSKKCVLMKL